MYQHVELGSKKSQVNLTEEGFNFKTYIENDHEPMKSSPARELVVYCDL